MRRYTLHIPPVAHLNGKLAPSTQVVHNQPDSSESEDGFYYGYRYRSTPNVSRYAIRDKARNLSEHPYTPGEERVKSLFTNCVNLARELLRDPLILPNIRKAYNGQRHYTRLYNYTIGVLVVNNGNPPPEWGV